ncbi:MAG: restriction endonuclease [Thaumarchaeota archaeon]|nr:restriction endonuclease [Nitrososphaerota archaeon]MDE1818182.1 restriction endonuclease [Nitrososphaerota archaeon]MDE1876382.1 restriction endonuclease [Nitrososphaerota archaeon]
MYCAIKIFKILNNVASILFEKYKTHILNVAMLAKGIPGIIPGGLSVKDFSMATQTSEDLSKEILDNLMQNGIGKFEEGQIQFEDSDKLKTSIIAISMGAPIDEISRMLEWQDFESLAAEVLERRDFETTKNVIMRNPRIQIDVVGIKSEVAILIDCKHWSSMTQSALHEAVKKQVIRTRQFVSKHKVRGAIPAIVTLYQHSVQFIDKVPIIPIHQLDSFCDEFYGNLEEMQS